MRWLVLTLFIVLPLSAWSVNCNDIPKQGSHLYGTGTTLGNPGTVIEFNSRQNQLNVIAVHHYLKDVLAGISNATGIVFADYSHRPCERISIQFDALPLNEALSRVIGNRSYILQKDEKKRLTVWLLPAGTQERLIDADIRKEEFYDGLHGNVQVEELAEQIRQLEE